MKESMLPCFKCGVTLMNAVPNALNQPSGGTEFSTEGHYGSTFWDSFNGEYLVLNICDDCLSAHAERLAIQKRRPPQYPPRTLVPYVEEYDR